MTDTFLNNLNRIRDEAQKNLQNIEQLYVLKKQTQDSFNEKIKELSDEFQVMKKVQMRRAYIYFTNHRGNEIQIPISWRYLVSAPFIYGMIAPAILWHISIEIYHTVCFRLYGIPLVKGSEYFVLDRQLLKSLNIVEKINCYYCSYVNNLVRYSVEIAERTERYWCPIKYYRKIKHAHSQYNKFANNVNDTEMRSQWEELRKFSDLKK